ncbi:DUF1730 domain-containing protein [Candidatus Marinimicrobia bacterium]|nr:DUF1730 domain-containing protein [Candidatus Neomarinimicrobiota bacterium]
MKNFSELLKSKAKTLGFEKVGIARAEETPREKSDLNKWIENDGHASMEWLKKRKDERGDIHTYFPEAKSVISVGLNYYVGKNQDNIYSDYKFSNYAWGGRLPRFNKKKAISIISMD